CTLHANPHSQEPWTKGLDLEYREPAFYIARRESVMKPAVTTGRKRSWYVDNMTTRNVAGLILVVAASVGVAHDAPPEQGSDEVRGVLIGTAVNAAALQSDPYYREALGVGFTSVTPEDAMKWAVVEPVRGQFDWRQADAITDFAGQLGQRVRGHTLVWHDS